MTDARDTTARLTQAGLNLIGQALSIYDADLRLAVSNRRYADMFGLPAALTRPGTSFAETVRFLAERGEYGPLRDPESMVAERVAQARAFEPHYLERTRPDGTVISVEGAPLPQGGWVTVYTDITPTRAQERLLRARSEVLSEALLERAEQLSLANRRLAAANAALEQARAEATAMAERIRLTTEMLPAHIARVGTDGRYTFSNRRLGSVMPGAPAEIVGLTMEEALGPATWPRARPHLERALAGRAETFEITHEPSGRRVRVSLTPEAEGDAVIGAYVLSVDITAEAQARAAVSQASGRQIAAQLTSGMAHDFGNLLTVILGQQDRLAALDLPEEAREAVAAIGVAADRGAALLGQIGRLSGERSLQPRATDIAALLAELRTLASGLPAMVRLDTEVEGALPPVLLDPDALRDALLNLVLNARDALMERGGGRIRVSARAAGAWLSISVEDDGPGFSAPALERGLAPFFTTKGEDGSGLGLSMVYDTVKLSGGRVRLENRRGGGARVALRLPLRTPPPGLPPCLVLLVEDARHIREAVRHNLVAAGHTVLEAATAEEAAAMLDVEGIGLVLTDVMLRSDLTGLDVARAAEAAGLRVALMTSLPPDAPLRRQGAARWPVISKPFSAEKLAAAMEGRG
jgi:signal transduction histidine kinase